MPIFEGCAGPTRGLICAGLLRASAQPQGILEPLRRLWVWHARGLAHPLGAWEHGCVDFGLVPVQYIVVWEVENIIADAEEELTVKDSDAQTATKRDSDAQTGRK